MKPFSMGVSRDSLPVRMAADAVADYTIAFTVDGVRQQKTLTGFPSAKDALAWAKRANPRGEDFRIVGWTGARDDADRQDMIDVARNPSVASPELRRSAFAYWRERALKLTGQQSIAAQQRAKMLEPFIR